MAAFRRREIRFISKALLKRRNAFLKRLKRKGKRWKGRIPKGFPKARLINKWELVATTPEEVASGMYVQTGDVYVFQPQVALDRLWERIRSMHMPEHIEVWSDRDIGIKQFITRLKRLGKWRDIDLPGWMKPTYPSSLLDIPAEKKTPKWVKTEGGMVKLVETIRYFPYEELIKQLWIPEVLLKSRGEREGLFSNQSRARKVARMFAIHIDPRAKKAQWMRPETPETMQEGQRGVQIDPEAYQEALKFVREVISRAVQEDRALAPVWNLVLSDYLDPMFGAQAHAVLARLKVDLTPVTS